MKTEHAALRTACALALAGVATPLWAAGGHHDVDDASMLERGQCEVETWAGRAADRSDFAHGGLNCGVGPVELGIGAERPRGNGERSRVLQLKSALPLAGGWSVGGVLARANSGSDAGTVTNTWMALLSWSGEPVAVHFNFGRDHVRGAGNSKRAGLGVDWTFRDSWTATGEVFRLQDTNSWRVGLRHEVREGISVDVSRAAGFHGRTPGRWVVGATLAFGG